MSDMPAQQMSSREFLGRLLSEGKLYWPVFLGAVLGMVITAATEPTLAWLMKWLLDDGLKSSASFNPWWVPVVLVGLFILRGAGTFSSTFCMHWLANRITANLRLRMFDRMLRLPTSHIDNQSTASYVSLLVFEASNATLGLGAVVTTLLRDSLVVIGLLGWLLYLNWKLTLIVLVMLPLVGFLVFGFTKRIRQLAGHNVDMTAELTQFSEEAVANHKVVKVYGGHASEMGRFSAVTEKLRNFNRRIIVSQALQVPVTQCLAAIALSAVVMIAITQVRADQTSIGGFVSFVTAMLMLLTPLRHLADINGHLQKAAASANVVFRLIDRPIESDTGTNSLGENNAAQPGRAKGLIEFRDVCLTYDDAAKPALERVSFIAQPGKTVALVGPSGGGKTSVANLVPRFYVPQTGQILIDSEPIESFSLASLRANIAVVSQEVLLFNASLAENIAYGASAGASRERIQQAASAAYLNEFIESLPQGLDTEIGERGVKLSGGQRQRLAIARAILKDAPILVLDEATSALDTESERYVQAALDGLMKQRTTLVIAHRLSTIQSADQILVMVQGEICERGTHNELMAKAGVYKNLFSAGNLEKNQLAEPSKTIGVSGATTGE